jgi:hypothetical protein
MLIKLALTALLSLGVGAAGTYATVHVTATCSVPAVAASDDGMRAFLAKPAAPLSGYPRY